MDLSDFDKGDLMVSLIVMPANVIIGSLTKRQISDVWGLVRN